MVLGCVRLSLIPEKVYAKRFRYNSPLRLYNHPNYKYVHRNFYFKHDLSNCSRYLNATNAKTGVFFTHYTQLKQNKAPSEYFRKNKRFLRIFRVGGIVISQSDFIQAFHKYITNFLLSTGSLMFYFSYFTSGTQRFRSRERDCS